MLLLCALSSLPKDKVSESPVLSYEFVGICATGSIAISIGRLVRIKHKAILTLISKSSLFLELIIVITNLYVVSWAKNASFETAIPCDIV